MSVIRSVFGLLRQIFGWAFALAEWLTAAFSTAMDFALRPNTLSGRVALRRFAPWAFLNLLAVAAVTLRMPAGHALPQSVVAAICGVGFVVSLLIVSSSLLKLREDNDVMNGLVPEDSRKFHFYAAASDHVVVASAIVFMVLFLAAAIQEMDYGYPAVLSESAPHLSYGAYLLATLKALPVSGVLITLASWIGEQRGVALTMFGFGNVSGKIAEHVITVIGSVFLVGLVALWLKQIRDTDRLVDQYLKAGTAERAYLQQRVMLSLLLIKPRIIRAAVTPRAIGKQTLAIDAAVELGIIEFPREFCSRYGANRNRSIKRRGLEAALQIFEAQPGQFNNDLLIETLCASVRPIERTKFSGDHGVLATRLALALMRRAPNLSGTPKETVAFLNNWLQRRLSEKPENEELVVPVLEVALRHGFVEAACAFVANIKVQPADVATSGLRLIREKIGMQYGPSPLSLQVVEPLKKALAGKLTDEVRAPAEQLLQSVIARNTPQPTLAQRAFGWVGLKSTPNALPPPPSAPSSASRSSHAA